VILVTGCKPDSDAQPQNQKVSDSVKSSVRGNVYENIDQSPLDISYYPPDYTEKKMAGFQTADVPVARVIYSRPHRKGRKIFSDDENSLCRYNTPWRLGANEATEIEFFRPVVINGKNIAAGKYVLYAIPYPDKWIVAINSNIYSWGLQIDFSKDISRVEVVTQEQQPALEDFTMVFEKAPYGANLIMAWDNVKTKLPITFSEL
jgi:hypothetical protein